MKSSKKIIYMSVEDLRDLGLIPKKYTRKRTKGRKKKDKVVFVDSSGNIIKIQDGFGGPKSDSSQMVGGGQTISQPTQFTNSANVGTAIQSMQLQALEDAQKKKKEEALTPNENNQIVPSTDRFQNNSSNFNKIDKNLFQDLFRPAMERINDRLIENSNGIINTNKLLDDDKLANQNRFLGYDKNFKQGFEIVNQLKQNKVNYDETDNTGISPGTAGDENFIPQGKPSPIVDRFSQDKPQTPSFMDTPVGQHDMRIAPEPTMMNTPMRPANNDDIDETVYHTAQVDTETSDVNTPMIRTTSKKGKPSVVLQGEGQQLFKDESNANTDDNTVWVDEKEDKKVDLTPETALINKNLEKKGRGAKANLKDSLKVYVALGGKDANILTSTRVMIVQGAIKKLKKEKGLNF
jgi:hypothetical protein